METKTQNENGTEALNKALVSRSAYRIFRTKQEEYWDIWCEDAIVFPKEKPLNEVFTEENLRKLIDCYSDKNKYTYHIDIRENEVVVNIDSNPNEGDIHFEFVEMAAVIVVQ